MAATSINYGILKMSTKKQSLRERLLSQPYREPTEGELALQSENRAKLKRWIEYDLSFRKELTGGSDCEFEESLELMEATGYVMRELDEMPSSQWEKLRKAVLRFRRKRSADQYSAPMLKADVARLLGIKPGALARRIKRGELRVTDMTYRTIRVHLGDLPK